MKKKVGLILGSIFLFSLVLVGVVMVQAAEAPTTATVTVVSFLSVTVDDATLVFGALDPSAANNKPLDDPLVATIGSESNVNAGVRTRANGANFCTDFPTCSGNTFAISNLEWDITDSFSGISYTTIDANVCTGVTPGASCNIFHELKIPSNQPAGTYSLGITVSAIAGP